MPSFEVKRYHDISCGHRVYGHESKCAHLHGHNYRIHFTCQPIPIYNTGPGKGGLDEVGRVIDFSVVKELLCEWLEVNWDHRFLVYQKDPWYMQLYAFDQTVKSVPFNPTAENMARYLVEIIGPQQLNGTQVELTEVLVEETSKCWAVYRKHI